jgi:hypothetical protein
MIQAIRLPREEIRPAWRAAILAYPANMRVTRHNDPAGDAAFREALPEMPEEQAKQETTTPSPTRRRTMPLGWRGIYGTPAPRGL